MVKPHSPKNIKSKGATGAGVPKVHAVQRSSEMSQEKKKDQLKDQRKIVVILNNNNFTINIFRMCLNEFIRQKGR